MTVSQQLRATVVGHIASHSRGAALIGWRGSFLCSFKERGRDLCSEEVKSETDKGGEREKIGHTYKEKVTKGVSAVHLIEV